MNKNLSNRNQAIVERDKIDEEEPNQLQIYQFSVMQSEPRDENSDIYQRRAAGWNPQNEIKQNTYQFQENGQEQVMQPVIKNSSIQGDLYQKTCNKYPPFPYIYNKQQLESNFLEYSQYQDNLGQYDLDSYFIESGYSSKNIVFRLYSSYWNSQKQQTYMKLWNFLKRKSIWKNLSKCTSNGLVLLIAGSLERMSEDQQNEIIKHLDSIYQTKDSTWDKWTSSTSQIKLKKAQIKFKINSKWLVKKKKKQCKGFFYLKNLQILFREVGIVDLKETEEFDTLTNKLETQLIQSNHVQNLKEVVKQLKVHKTQKTTKKTINFTSQDILELYKLKNFKNVIDEILRLINEQVEIFFNDTNINDLNGSKKQNNKTNTKTNIMTNLERLKKLIVDVQVYYAQSVSQ